MLARFPGVRRSHLQNEQRRAVPAAPRRLLILRDGGLGDMILTAPILRSLRTALGPEARIDLMCRAQSGQVIEGTGLADTIHPIGIWPFQSWVTLRRMRQNRYDLVIDLVLSASLSWTLRLLIAASSAYRVGGDKGDLAPMYNANAELPPRISHHFLERLHKITVSVFKEIPLDDTLPWLGYPLEIEEQAKEVWRVVGDDGRRVIWINLSAGRPRRQWPAANYHALIVKLLCDPGFAKFRWVLSAAPEDHPVACKIASMLRNPIVTVLPVESDFRVVIEMLKRADLILTPDTSIVHAASALGKSAVVMSVAENAVTWAPWRVQCEVITASPGEPVGCIAVDDVAMAMRRIHERLAY